MLTRSNEWFKLRQTDRQTDRQKSKIISIISKLFLIFLLSAIYIPNTYANEEYNYLYDIIEEQSSGENNISKFDGEHQDSINGDKKIFYYSGENAKNNIVFNNMCWKIIRTTDDGGIKLLYNGIPNNNTCEDNREDIFKEEVIENNLRINTSTNYKFGSDYYYDKTAKKYILSGDIIRTNFNESGSDLLNKYLCSTGGESCDKLYKIKSIPPNGTSSRCLIDGHIMNITDYNVIDYHKISKIDDFINYNLYMYSNDYYYDSKKVEINFDVIKNWDGIRFSSIHLNLGKNVEFENSKYKLNDIKWLNSYGHVFNESNKELLRKYKFFCQNTDYICDSINYIYSYKEGNTRNQGEDKYVIIDYIKLSGINKFSDFFESINTSDIHKIDSELKVNLEKWGKNNLDEDLLDDIFYCNNATLLDEGNHSYYNSVWNLDYDTDYSNNSLFYEGYDTSRNSLKCNNSRDNFSVNKTESSNGKLKYPIALLTSKEVMMTLDENDNTFLDNTFLTFTPGSFTKNSLMYYNTKKVYETSLGYSYAIRPVVTLIPKIKISGGDGSSTNPYIVKTYNKNDITIDNNNSFGKVSIDKLNDIVEGKNIIFKVNSNNGYNIKNINIIDSNNDVIEYEETSNHNEYSFIMPDNDVTISVEYEDVVSDGEKIYKDFSLKTDISEITEAIRDKENNIVVSGADNKDKLIVEKYDKNNHYLWSVNLDNYYYSTSMTIDDENNIYVLGFKDKFYHVDSLNTDIDCKYLFFETFLIKIDTNGNIIYEKSINNNDFSYETVSIEYKDNKIFVLGSSLDFNGNIECDEDDNLCILSSQLAKKVKIADNNGVIIKEIEFYKNDNYNYEIDYSSNMFSCFSMLGLTRYNNIIFDDKYFYVSYDDSLSGFQYAKIGYDGNVLFTDSFKEKDNYVTHYMDIDFDNNRKLLKVGTDYVDDERKFYSIIKSDDNNYYLNSEYGIIQSINNQDNGYYIFASIDKNIEGLNNVDAGKYIIRLDYDYNIKDYLKISDRFLFSNKDSDSCVFGYEGNTISRYCIESNESYEKERTIYIKSERLNLDNVFEKLGNNQVKWKVKNNKILKIENNEVVPLQIGKTDLNTVYDGDSYLLHIIVEDEKNEIVVPDTLKNPNTGDKLLITIFILIVSICISTIAYIITKKQKYITK